MYGENAIACKIIDELEAMYGTKTRICNFYIVDDAMHGAKPIDKKA